MTGPVDLEISKIFEKIWEIVYTNSSDVGYLEFFAIIKTLSIFSMKVAVDDQKTDSNEINEAVRQAPLFSTAIFLHYIHSGKKCDPISNIFSRCATQNWYGAVMAADLSLIAQWGK